MYKRSLEWIFAFWKCTTIKYLAIFLKFQYELPTSTFIIFKWNQFSADCIALANIYTSYINCKYYMRSVSITFGKQTAWELPDATSLWKFACFTGVLSWLMNNVIDVWEMSNWSEPHRVFHRCDSIWLEKKGFADAKPKSKESDTLLLVFIFHQK